MDSAPSAPAAELEAALARFRSDYFALRQEIGRVIVGQLDVLDGTLSALLAGGHVLLEGVPGLGKTYLVRTIAAATRTTFQRIQFTPDLMPSDLVGTNVLHESDDGRRVFRYQPGPVFANLLLADEINRATPRTQSALLEAMAERHVTVAGTTHPLPKPFFVLATQNPIEQEGTYPLPEAQLDRFLVKLIVEYPNKSDLDTILLRTTEVEEPAASPVIDAARLLELAKLVRQLPVPAEVRGFAIDAVLAAHPDQPKASDLARRYVRYGPSPRGLQAIILLAKVRAALDSRYSVARADIQAVALSALRHRVILNFEGQAQNVRPDDVVRRALDVAAGRKTTTVAVPPKPVPQSAPTMDIDAASSTATMSFDGEGKP